MPDDKKKKKLQKKLYKRLHRIRKTTSRATREKIRMTRKQFSGDPEAVRGAIEMSDPHKKRQKALGEYRKGLTKLTGSKK